MAIWRMRIACWIVDATNTHSEYVILIASLGLQSSHERPSQLRYTKNDFCFLVIRVTQQFHLLPQKTQLPSPIYVTRKYKLFYTVRTEYSGL